MTAAPGIGRLIAVVGPSGVGKDSIMAGLVAADPAMMLVRRTITRPAELGGEDYDAVDNATFAHLVSADAFCLHWGAHGLRYGIPRAALEHTRAGGSALANLSRSALAPAADIFPALTVLHITATPEVLAARLTARGRETPDEIAARLAQAAKPLPPHDPAAFDLFEISNNGPLADAIAQAQSALSLASSYRKPA